MTVRAYVVVGFIIKKLKRKNSVETCKNNPDFIEIIELPNKFESTPDLVKKNYIFLLNFFSNSYKGIEIIVGLP